MEEAARRSRGSSRQPKVRNTIPISATPSPTGEKSNMPNGLPSDFQPDLGYDDVGRRAHQGHDAARQ